MTANAFAEDVQASMDAGINGHLSEPIAMEEVEKTTISKYFAYIDMEHVSEYCYVDNKQNVYTRS